MSMGRKKTMSDLRSHYPWLLAGLLGGVVVVVLLLPREVVETRQGHVSTLQGFRPGASPIDTLWPPGHVHTVLYDQHMSLFAFHGLKGKILEGIVKNIGKDNKEAGAVLICGLEYGEEAEEYAGAGFRTIVFEPLSAWADKFLARVPAKVAQNIEMHKLGAAVQRRYGVLEYQGKSESVIFDPVDDHVTEHVLLMALDTQGTEYEILLGAQNLLTQWGVDVLEIEIVMEERDPIGGPAHIQKMLEMLDGMGYVLFDFSWWGSRYNSTEKLCPSDAKKDSPPQCYVASPRPTSLSEYIPFMHEIQRSRFNWMQSDILAVRRDLFQNNGKLKHSSTVFQPSVYSINKMATKLGGGEKCPICTKTVYATEKLPIDNKSFHKACFKCDTCKVTLNKTNFVAFNEKYYCKVHKPAVTPLATGQNLLKTNAGDVKPSPRGPSGSVSQSAATGSAQPTSNGTSSQANGSTKSPMIKGMSVSLFEKLKAEEEGSIKQLTPEEKAAADAADKEERERRVAEHQKKLRLEEEERARQKAAEEEDARKNAEAEHHQGKHSRSSSSSSSSSSSQPAHEEPKHEEPKHEEPQPVEAHHEEPTPAEVHHEEPKPVEPVHAEPAPVAETRSRSASSSSTSSSSSSNAAHEATPTPVEQPQPVVEEPKHVEVHHEEPKHVEPAVNVEPTPVTENRSRSASSSSSSSSAAQEPTPTPVEQPKPVEETKPVEHVAPAEPTTVHSASGSASSSSTSSSEEEPQPKQAEEPKPAVAVEPTPVAQNGTVSRSNSSSSSSSASESDSGAKPNNNNPDAAQSTENKDQQKSGTKSNSSASSSSSSSSSEDEKPAEKPAEPEKKPETATEPKKGDKADKGDKDASKKAKEEAKLAAKKAKEEKKQKVKEEKAKKKAEKEAEKKKKAEEKKAKAASKKQK